MLNCFHFLPAAILRIKIPHTFQNFLAAVLFWGGPQKGAEPWSPDNLNRALVWKLRRIGNESFFAAIHLLDYEKEIL